MAVGEIRLPIGDRRLLYQGCVHIFGRKDTEQMERQPESSKYSA